jgi:hypothetical protein
MKQTLMAALAALLVLVPLATDALAACNSPTKVAKGPNGQTKVVCLDGKYSTCMRDSQSLGWCMPKQSAIVTQEI